MKQIYKNKYLYLVLIFLILFGRFDVNFNYLKILLSNDGGAKESVPIEIYNLKNFIDSLNIEDFQTLGKLRNSNILYQRSIEYIYPIRFDENSKNIFSIEIIDRQDCFKKTTYKEIYYYVCKQKS